MNEKTRWIPAALTAALISIAVIGTTALKAMRLNGFGSHYHLTADVEVSDRHYLTSQNYTYTCARSIPAQQGVVITPAPCELTGEALRIDLGPRGKLFVLMTGWAPGHTGFSGADPLVHQLLYAAQHGQSVPVPALPVMVRFRDPTDPDSVEIVDPAHLDRSFGAGVRLVSMTVDERPVKNTGTIDTVLPWLSELKGGRLSPKAGTLAHQFHAYDFKWPPQ